MPEGLEKYIGANVAKARKERELTQAQLAETVNTTIETISRIERGISIPSLKTLEKISKALHIHINEILSFECPPIKKSSVKESEKLLAYLKTRKPAEIKMSYRILRNVFDEIERNYQPKK